MDQPSKTHLQVGNTELDLPARKVRRNGQEVALQPREVRLLEVLMRNPNRVVTRQMLLDIVWQSHATAKTNIVDTHVSRLRSKLAQLGEPELIETIRGAGYAVRVVV